jgi:hypothetical protein
MMKGKRKLYWCRKINITVWVCRGFWKKKLTTFWVVVLIEINYKIYLVTQLAKENVQSD